MLSRIGKPAGAIALAVALISLVLLASRAYPESIPIAPSAEMYMFAPPTRLNLEMILAVVLAVAI